MYIWEEISQLDHADLFNLLSEYDRYVIEVCDREDGSVPVCVAEFYMNEYQEILEGERPSYGESNEDYMRYNVEDGGMPNNEIGDNTNENLR